MSNEVRDARYLRLALRHAERSVLLGNHPFGCVVVATARRPIPPSWITWVEGGGFDDRLPSDRLLPEGHEVILANGFNTVNSEHDPSGHAETNAVRIAAKRVHEWDCLVRAQESGHPTLRFGDVFSVELFTSTEPCAMCCGCIYWSFLFHRVVYACPESGLAKYVGNDFLQPCRSIFEKGTSQRIVIDGPLLAADEAEAVHAAYEGWKPILLASSVSSNVK